MKQFYESQEQFEKWRETVFVKSVPVGHIYGDRIMVEKWELDAQLHIVEIFPDGHGFSVYKKIR